MTYKEEFIKFMTECGVLTFGDFTLKSGRKAPYFVNTGNYKTGRQLCRYVNAGLVASLALLVIGVLVMAVCLLLSPLIPVWMGAEASVQGPASAYFFITSLSLIFRTCGYVFGSAIRATKDTKTPMMINLSANALNVKATLHARPSCNTALSPSSSRDWQMPSASSTSAKTMTPC